jgi:hypothetical protein
VIFVAEDVGQHGEAVAVLDQAHGDTGHVRLERHTGVHQRQTAAADGSHRRGTVGFGDFRNHAHRVREIFRLRQHGQQRTLGQTAVTDFATLRRTDATAFAGGVRGHVVVQHEAVAVLTGQRIDDLLVAVGTERGDTSAWVSPRVNRAEPWVRGRTPERMVIGRTVRVSRPSIRGSPPGCGHARWRLRFVEQVADSDSRRRSAFAFAQGGHTSARISLTAWLRVCLTVML